MVPFALFAVGCEPGRSEVRSCFGPFSQLPSGSSILSASLVVTAEFGRCCPFQRLSLRNKDGIPASGCCPVWGSRHASPKACERLGSLCDSYVGPEMILLGRPERRDHEQWRDCHSPPRSGCGRKTRRRCEALSTRRGYSAISAFSEEPPQRKVVGTLGVTQIRP